MDVRELKRRSRAAWALGDYPAVAETLWPAAEAVVAAAGIEAGDRVLDVGAGNGNGSVVAARLGAKVVASDLSPRMVELGRARTEAEGLEVEWTEGDAEELPFEDGGFDRVVSVFGAFIAPRPRVVAEELVRVTRTGGTIALSAWTPDSSFGELFALMTEYVPPPEGVPRPMEWGVEEVARERFAGLGVELRFERQAIPYRFDRAEDVWDHYGKAGPQEAARRSLEPERQAELKRDFTAKVRELSGGSDGPIDLASPYLITVARRQEPGR
jgi:SAM-dependent methyltransferase